MRVMFPKVDVIPHLAAVAEALAMMPHPDGMIEFDAIRAELGLTDSELPDGTIHQAASDMGLAVERTEGERRAARAANRPGPPSA